MIAMALACDPVLLIADEPTTALDVTVQAEILDLLRDLHQRLDSAILLITHDMGVVADLADRVVVMREGRIVETGTAQEVFAFPQNEYTRDLLAAVPHLGPRSGSMPRIARGDEVDAAARDTRRPGRRAAAREIAGRCGTSRPQPRHRVAASDVMAAATDVEAAARDVQAAATEASSVLAGAAPDVK